MHVNVSKGLCLVILFVVSLVFGWLPIWLRHRGTLTSTTSSRRRLVLDLLNCLAGGVFLGVCLLHLLEEGREDFQHYKDLVHFHTDFPLYETVAGVGLFLIAVIEKIGFAIMGYHRREDMPSTASTLEAPAPGPAPVPGPSSGTAPGPTPGPDSARFDTEPAAEIEEEDTTPLSSRGSKASLQASLPADFETLHLPQVSMNKDYGAVSSETTPLLRPGGDQADEFQASGYQAGGEDSETSPPKDAAALHTTTDLFVGQDPPKGSENQRFTGSLTLPSRKIPGARSRTRSLDKRVPKRQVLAPWPSPATLRGEGSESLSSPEREAPDHHHHHTGLVATVACRPHNMAEMSTMRALLLLVALSFHTVFDGLAVGLQHTSALVWGIMTGISVHKAVVAFCLGLDLAMTSRTGVKRPLLIMFIFSFIAPLGLAIGMAVTDSRVDLFGQLLTSAILQALATGIFLYVTFFEILDQQFAHGHIAGRGVCTDLLKVGVAVLGFAAMAGVKLLDN